MKKAILLLFLFIVSCSTDNEIETINESEATLVNNQPEIREFHSYYRFTFTDNKLSRIKRNSTNIDFLYDDTNRLVQLIYRDLSENIIESKLITYSLDNRISSIGNRDFSYNSTENIYIDNSSFYESIYSENGINSIERSYSFFKVNSENIVFSANRHEYNFEENTNTNQISEGEHINISLELLFENDNIIKIETDNNNYEINYSYDLNYLNPLNTNSSNLKDIFILLGIDTIHYYAKLFSKNNHIAQRYGVSDPESNTYINYYNYNNLPYKVDRQSYYLGVLEIETPNAIQYYYEGDTIPN